MIDILSTCSNHGKGALFIISGYSYELFGEGTVFTYLIPTVRMVKVISLKMTQQFY